MRRVRCRRRRGGRRGRWGEVRRGEGFNSRAHGGRDTFCRFIFYNLILFQFTRPRGARLRLSCVPRGSNPFQFTRPRGARQAVDEPVERLDEFQFTRPRGARPLVFSCRLGDDRFNSRAHGGRDPSRRTCAKARSVSIHAPTGGATFDACGASSTDLFQFTRPRGARLGVVGRARAPPEVSIHAPTGGTTLDPAGGDALTAFQFTRPRGARPHWRGGFPPASRFQFTRPRGARRRVP